jgi:hypothetical protein
LPIPIPERRRWRAATVITSNRAVDEWVALFDGRATVLVSKFAGA